MKKTDLSAKFTPYLMDAIAEGFVPCMTELSGSYSGIFGHQVVLSRDCERIVMWMEEEAGSYADGTPDVVDLYVSRFALAKGERTDFHHMWPKDWKRHLVAQMRVYEVSSRKGGWYVESLSEASHAMGVRRSRFDSRPHVACVREYEVTDKLLGIARRLKGFKTIRRENLHVCKLQGAWVFQNKVSHREVMLGA
jgi:hypothetical protein